MVPAQAKTLLDENAVLCSIATVAGPAIDVGAAASAMWRPRPCGDARQTHEVRALATGATLPAPPRRMATLIASNSRRSHAVLACPGA